MIKTNLLTKEYGPIKAVNRISFTVEAGEVLGFLGPNGAGKSTTMKMIAGFVEPTAGTASIFGHDVVKEPIACKSQIGYLPEGAPSYGEMTPEGFLSFIASVRGMDKSTARDRLGHVIELLHLEGVRHQTIETLSKGFKRRVGLAQAILHDPRILILDEPTDGLDPNQKHEVRSLIQHMAKDKIIVVSTHILEEVSAVCTRAIIIAEGKLLADETPASLQAKAPRHNRIVVTTASNTESQALRAALQSLDGVNRVLLDDTQLVVEPLGGKNLIGDIARLVAQGQHQISDMHLEQGSLDEVFREITLGPAVAAPATEGQA